MCGFLSLEARPLHVAKGRLHFKRALSPIVLIVSMQISINSPSSRESE